MTWRNGLVEFSLARGHRLVGLGKFSKHEVLVSQRLVEILNCLTNFNRRWPFEETAVETYRVAGLYIVQNQDVPDYWMVALEGREFLPTLEEPAPRFFPFLEGGRHRHPVYAVR